MFPQNHELANTINDCALMVRTHDKSDNPVTYQESYKIVNLIIQSRFHKCMPELFDEMKAKVRGN